MSSRRVDSLEVIQVFPLEDLAYLSNKVDEVARLLRDATPGRRTGPFDPYACADQLGVRVDFVDLPKTLGGRVNFLGDEISLGVRKDDPPLRQRFTVAHELAHLCFLERGCIGGHKLAADQSQSIEETLCDRIASELLMPRVRFCRQARRLSPGFAAVLQLGMIFQVSVSATLQRLAVLRPWSFLDLDVDVREPNPGVATYRTIISRSVRGYRQRRRKAGEQVALKEAIERDLQTNPSFATQLRTSPPGFSEQEIRLPRSPYRTLVRRSGAKLRAIVFFA